MFEMLPESSGPVVGVRATGRLTDADYKEFLPKLEKVIAEHGSVRLLVDMEGFEGWNLMAAWDDFAFGIKHWNDFSKMAIVGDAKWEEMATKAADLLMKGEARFFSLDERDAAWNWVRE